MTLIEFVIPLVFAGFGAWGGVNLISLFYPTLTIVGGIGGALGGLGIMFLIGYLLDLQSEKNPQCKCGNSNWNDFKLTENTAWDYVRQCHCGHCYLMEADRRWYKIGPNNKAILYMQRTFLGKWKPARKKKILLPPK